ncbi:hypothetical protein [Pediococcus inopinatus]|uniref:hypothetical protein n=1 Tax=Pediococcus inopinatus TaxID=114090 RepID=UPI00131A2B3F|nr:hypothetical protein [Pediococcus inopinatus]
MHRKRRRSHEIQTSVSKRTRRNIISDYFKSFKKLGGQSNIGDLKKEIALYSDDLGKFAAFEKMSRGNRLYRPFDYIFNFAVQVWGLLIFYIILKEEL